MSRPHSEMNVTPLIDILLVLLVMFLAALPLTQQAIDTQLPARTRAPGRSAPGGQIVLEYAADGRISINHQEVNAREPRGLEDRLRDIYAGRRDKTLYIAAAPSLRYQRIIDVLDAARGAGVVRLGVITDGMRREAARNR